MESWMWIFGVLTVGLVAFPVVRPNPKRRALAQARANGDLEPLVDYISRRADPATAWDQILLELWRRYERRLAAEVLVVAVPGCDHKILQHWIMKVLQFEPEIAQEVFTEDFLLTRCRPDVAATCGKCGCKG